MNDVLTAGQLAQEAQAVYRRGDYPAAVQSFQAAAQAYDVSGHALEAAEMRSNLSVAFLQAGDAAAALHALQGVEDIFGQAADRHRQALAMGNRAMALDALGDTGQAAQVYQACAELLAQVGDYESRSHVMQALSRLQLSQGRQFEALATMQAGVADIPRPNVRQRLLRRLLRIPMDMLGK